MTFQQIKFNTFFRVILTGKSFSYIIFMIQGQHQGQKVNFKVK